MRVVFTTIDTVDGSLYAGRNSQEIPLLLREKVAFETISILSRNKSRSHCGIEALNFL